MTYGVRGLLWSSPVLAGELDTSDVSAVARRLLAKVQAVRGSHRGGVLTTDAVRAVPLSEYRPCAASRGDILTLRPLLLHRGGASATAIVVFCTWSMRRSSRGMGCGGEVRVTVRKRRRWGGGRYESRVVAAASWRS